MSQHSTTTRRRALRMLAGAPMLPLGIGSLAAVTSLSACGGGDAAAAPPAANGARFVSAEFTGMAAPTLATPAAMATTSVASSLKVRFDDGSSKSYQLAFQPFFLTGDLVPDGKGGQILAGGYYDIFNNKIIDRTVAGKERQYFSDSPDGTSLLTVPGAKVDGVKGNPVFAVVQFEYTTWAQDGKTDMYGKLPSPIAVLTLDQDPASGELTLVKYHNVDTSGVHGLWITCGASLSPWGTHLSSEEYEPDAFTTDAKAIAQLQAFSQNLYGDPARANPYHYGHQPEVVVHADGTASIRKHYCLGRISHELVQVMPDQRTVLMGDDATNSGYFVFVADKEKDLSSGSLYVAKVAGSTDFTKVGSPAAPLTWIKLGSASSEDIRALVDGGIKPTDIMDVQAYKDDVTTPQPSPEHKKVTSNGKTEWIKVMPGKEQAAAFLETHRYAAHVGASMGFSKMEGTTVNIRDKVAYSALQNIQASMVAGHAANVPGNGVSVPKQLVAGGVMALNLRGGVQDDQGAAIASEWMPVDLKPLLVGEDLAVPDALGNTANADKIANPDNLKFSEKLRTLFIGEDSSQHVNNFLWAYDVDTKSLSRIMSIPAGGESTGLHAVDEVNGWTYIMSNFQHAGDWGKGPSKTFVDGLHAKVYATLDPLIDANYKNKFSAAVGYLTADLQPAARKT